MGHGLEDRRHDLAREEGRSRRKYIVSLMHGASYELHQIMSSRPTSAFYVSHRCVILGVLNCGYTLRMVQLPSALRRETHRGCIQLKTLHFYASFQSLPLAHGTFNMYLQKKSLRSFNIRRLTTSIFGSDPQLAWKRSSAPGKTSGRDASLR